MVICSLPGATTNATRQLGIGGAFGTGSVVGTSILANPSLSAALKVLAAVKGYVIGLPLALPG